MQFTRPENEVFLLAKAATDALDQSVSMGITAKRHEKIVDSYVAVGTTEGLYGNMKATVLQPDTNPITTSYSIAEA